MRRQAGTTIAVPTGALSGWSLDPTALARLADRHAEGYRSATPFPHVVIDGMFPDDLLETVAADFPEPSAPGWIRHDTPTQRKLQWADAAKVPPTAAYFMALLQSAAFLEFLQCLTGIPGLVGDPHLHHGGLHQIEPGGFLKVHADNISHPWLALYRRVNVIVYLDRVWEPAWGGELELWDEAMTACERRVAPCFNRTVIFDVRPDGNHGHPDPTRSPRGVTRRSIAMYYYTSPENPTTLWTGKQADRVRLRPGEVFGPARVSPRWRRLVRDLSPPALTRGLRRLRRLRRPARR